MFQRPSSKIPGTVPHRGHDHFSFSSSYSLAAYHSMLCSLSDGEQKPNDSSLISVFPDVGAAAPEGVVKLSPIVSEM